MLKIFSYSCMCVCVCVHAHVHAWASVVPHTSQCMCAGQRTTGQLVLSPSTTKVQGLSPGHQGCWRAPCQPRILFSCSRTQSHESGFCSFIAACTDFLMSAMSTHNPHNSSAVQHSSLHYGKCLTLPKQSLCREGSSENLKCHIWRSFVKALII